MKVTKKLVVIPLLLSILFCILAACDSTKRDKDMNDNTVSNNITFVDETTFEEIQDAQDTLDFYEEYTIVLEKYREAENSDYVNYDEKYVNYELFIVPNISPYYAFYDIDNNGVPELLIGSGGNWLASIWALNGNEPVNLLTFTRRARGWLINNNIILYEGSGGAYIHAYDFFKMSVNGYSVELENGFVREYLGAQGLPPTITQTNATGSQEISIDEFETIMKSYTGITAFPFDYEQLDTVKLDWKAIS